jgi:hypothetical protein
MPSRVTARAMFRWGLALLVGGLVISVLLATSLSYLVLEGTGQVGTMIFQWFWSLLDVAQYLGAALVAASLGVRALQGPVPVPSEPEQVIAERGPYGPGGGHVNPQP